MKKGLIVTLLCLLLVLITVPLRAADAPATTPPKEGEAHESMTLTEVNKKLTNPVSDFWSISFQQNNYLLDPGPGQSLRWNSNLLFQPVLPVALTKNWNLITRPVIPLFDSQPHPNPNDPADIERTTGFGDIIFLQMLSPSEKLVGNWLLGAWADLYPADGFYGLDRAGQVAGGAWRACGLPFAQMDPCRLSPELDLLRGVRE